MFGAQTGSGLSSDTLVMDRVLHSIMDGCSLVGMQAGPLV